MDERLKIIAAVLALAIVGAFALSYLASVPKGQYDALKTSCDEERASSAALLDAEKARADYAAGQLRGCENEVNANQGLLAAKNEEIEALQVDAGVLAQARVKANAHGQMALLLSYYLDAFGPGRVPNTPRVQKIEAQLASIGDAGLTGMWVDVKTCSALISCANAKDRFTGAIGTRMSLLANETAEIVKE